jgi:hypothetical protein
MPNGLFVNWLPRDCPVTEWDCTQVHSIHFGG